MSEPDPNLPPMAQAVPAGYAPQFPGAQPVPVQALPYSMPMPRYQRPGILSAITVIGIVVACLSTLASLMSGCQAGSFYMVSKMSNTMRTSSSAVTTTTTSGSTTSTFVYASPAGTNATVSASGGTPTTAPAPTTQAVTGTNPLTPTEIAGVVQRAQKITGNMLNTAQVNALTTALQDPNQDLVSPGTAWSPVQRGNVNPDGSAFLMFTGGFVTLDPQGQMTTNSMNNAMPNFNISGVTCLLAGLDALLSIALAIFLFVAAIIVMRNSPSGRRLHLIYATLKIPLAIGGGWVLGSLWSQLYGGMAAGVPGGTAALQTMAMVYALIFAGLGLIYPIALLIALNTRGVKEYYKPVQG